MTDEEIALQHARMEGVNYGHGDYRVEPTWNKDQVLAALSAARADERERCAELCVDMAYISETYNAADCADAIRALTAAK